MTTSSREDRQRFVTQTLASWGIEGFEPDAGYRALLDQYISGELNLEQIDEATDKLFGVTKPT